MGDRIAVDCGVRLRSRLSSPGLSSAIDPSGPSPRQEQPSCATVMAAGTAIANRDAGRSVPKSRGNIAAKLLGSSTMTPEYVLTQKGVIKHLMQRYGFARHHLQSATSGSDLPEYALRIIATPTTSEKSIAFVQTCGGVWETYCVTTVTHHASNPHSMRSSGLVANAACDRKDAAALAADAAATRLRLSDDPSTVAVESLMLRQLLTYYC